MYILTEGQIKIEFSKYFAEGFGEYYNRVPVPRVGQA